jgi:hypothetical protein
VKPSTRSARVCLVAALGIGPLGCRLEQDHLPRAGVRVPPPTVSGGSGGASPSPVGGSGPGSGEGGSAGGSGETPPATADAAPDAIPIVAEADAAVPPPPLDAGSDVPPAFMVMGASTWRGGATAAYSVVHDAVCDPAAQGAFTHADPELARRGLRGGFGVIVGSCGEGPASKWEQVRALAAHGHDVYNHSWSHACLGDAQQCAGNGMPSADLALQIDQATQVLAERGGVTAQFFSFPFDVCGQEGLDRLKQAGYLGARCGTRGVAPSSFPDPFAARFDSWGPGYSIYGNSGPCAGLTRPNTNVAPDTLSPACRRYVLDHYVDEAIAAKGWALRAFTGFTDDPGVFQPVSVADYTAHLDYVRSKVQAGQLWVEGPSAILRYRFARERCPLPTVVDGRTLRFAPASPECQRYATRVSYVVASTMLADAPNVVAVQGGVSTAAARIGRAAFIVTVDPTQGDAILGE